MTEQPETNPPVVLCRLEHCEGELDGSEWEVSIVGSPDTATDVPGPDVWEAARDLAGFFPERMPDPLVCVAAVPGGSEDDADGRLRLLHFAVASVPLDVVICPDCSGRGLSVGILTHRCFRCLGHGRILVAGGHQAD